MPAVCSLRYLDVPREPATEERIATDDRGLIARVAEKDHAALRALVDRHGSAMYRHARALSGDAAMAEDAVQEAFVSVWSHAASFRGETTGARGWLFAIVRNAVRAQVRKRARAAPDGSEDLDPLEERVGFGDADAGHALERALESREALAKGLELLSDDDREMLLLVDGEGLLVDEAASSVGITLAAAKSRLHRARLRLISVLSVEEGT